MGTTDVIGLPLRSDYVSETDISMASTWITASTGFTAAVTTSPATATTGDVRGTYTLRPRPTTRVGLRSSRPLGDQHRLDDRPVRRHPVRQLLIEGLSHEQSTSQYQGGTKMTGGKAVSDPAPKLVSGDPDVARKPRSAHRMAAPSKARCPR